MSLYLDDAPGEGWLFDSERARYSPAPFAHCVPRNRPNHDTLTIVSRDPCKWCGTRTDLGCKHTGGAL